MTLEYKILSAQDVGYFEQIMQEALQEGWNFCGPTLVYEDSLLREMVRETIEPAPQPPQAPEINDQDFKLRFDKLLDDKFKDLLFVNNIQLGCEKGKLFTMVGTDRQEGISPKAILSILKGSSHYPIDTDDNWVIGQVEQLL